MTTCRECTSNKPHFDFSWSAFQYNDPLRELIHAFKFNQRTFLRHFFARIMSAHISEYSFDIQQFDMLIPIPLFPTRFKERGYNQSELLAQLIGKEFNIPLSTKSLQKIRYTQNQSEMLRKERWTNIQGAFRMRPSLRLEDKKVLIIDDLLTTGATASEAARILKQNGAKLVGVFTLAVA
jgi:competence protein ComFC